jgi:hypothetical protein
MRTNNGKTANQNILRQGINSVTSLTNRDALKRLTRFRLLIAFLLVSCLCGSYLLISSQAASMSSLFDSPKATSSAKTISEPKYNYFASQATPLTPFTPGVCDTAGPIEVEGTIVGTTPTAYATLAAAFAAINAGTHTGAISIDVCGDTSEGATTATLNASGSGAAAYSSITMSPAGSAARTISGATTAGSPMIDLNGADNVTIDGLNTGGNSLTISNTTVSSTSGTSTIRFQADATNNTITNASVLGSATMAVGTNGGNIWFGSAAVTTGNDNNTVSNCNIGPAGANLPTKGIYFSGTSNTDPGTANSGITINNNNIFDYFSATVSSAGIDLIAGTVGTTISNNRFYQTATRTQTSTGLTHSGIRINNTTGNAYQITGNTIGFAAANGTGTYTFVFPSTTTAAFIPINLSVGTTTATSVQGNTIAGIAMSGAASGTSTSAPFRGIYVGSGLTTIGNVTGNTIGSQSATGSITYTSSSTSASDVMGMFNFGTSNWTVSNNNIGGITASNSSTGAANIYGIRLNTSSTATTTISNNLVGGTVANSLQSTAAAATAGTQVAGIFVSASIATLTSNTIRNLTAPGGTGTSTGASVAGIVFVSSGSVNNASQNTIFNLSNTNTTAATIVTGIQFTGGTGNVVQRNFIHSLTSATTSTSAEVNGIRVAGGTTTYRNNMIAIGAGINNAPGGAATNSSTAGIVGFNEVLGTNTVLHNSIYIGGSPIAGSGSSYAFNGVQTINARSFRDNIFYNARSNAGATGSNYAVKVNGTVPNPTGLTINNNVYFANGTGGVFGFFNSTNVANIAAWRTAVGQDAGSFESNPQYNDPTNATPDLHLHPTNPTVAEGNGVDLGVTDDFDGQTRSGLTPTDIGADAGNFVGIDLTAPNITYTPLLNTSSTANRTLSVTITDTTGVATGGLAPRIYFNKNMGTNFSTACSLASGTTINGVWNCTIDNSLIGGVVVADVIRYFVVAQDTLGNLASNPSAGFIGTDVNNVTTPPTTPNQYTIVGAASGSYNVGTGETYTSLTNTGGIFEFINNSEVTGSITINITTDLTGELGTVALNEFASPFTILIKPSGAPRTITGSNTGALIRLNGADRVRFDGSTAATFADNVVGGNPALRELTIQNTNTGTSAVVISVGSNGANGAQNNTIQNVRVLGQDPTTSLYGISLGGATPGTTATGPNNNNRVENCFVGRTIFGIYSAGQAAPNQNTGTVITMNETSALTADRIRRVGIIVFNENGVQITENSINGISTNEAFDAIGIGVGTQDINTTTTTSGGVINALVERNKINGVASLSTTGYSAAGITVAGGTGGANTIRNNMITGVTSPATTPDIVAGIYVVGATGSSTRLYHNSVGMTGDRSFTGTSSSQMPSYGLAVTGTDPTVELKNNIFYTTQIASTGGANALSYAVGMVTTTFANLDSNYNDFWSTGANDGGFRTGSLASAAGTSHVDLTAWQTAVSDDANSQEADPVFIDPATDLHLNALTTPLIGDGITGFATVDYDSDPRPATAPEIGADELVQSAAGSFPAGTFYNAIAAGGDTLAGNVTITNSITLNGVLNAGGNTLTIGCNATVSGASGSNYVTGMVRKDFCTTGSFQFPIGGGPMTFSGNTQEGVNLFTPVTANVTALGQNPSSLVATVTNAIAPATPPLDPMITLNRYWTLTEIGDVTADLTFNYLQTDVNGTENNYNIYRITGGGTPFVFPSVKQTPCGITSPCIDITNNIMFIGGVRNYSNWLAGELAPTAALAQVGGQIKTANGKPIVGALMSSRNLSNGQRLTATTDSQGRYNFDGQVVAQEYAITPVLNGYRFEPNQRVISLNGNRNDVDFVAIETNRNPSNDYDGDGIADLAVFRPSEGNWYIWQSSTNSLRVENWGVATDRIVPSDYDGDGRMDVAVYRPSEGNWYIKESFNGQTRIERWGLATDKVIPADYDGDGRTDIAVYRQSDNVWYIKQSSDGTIQYETLSQQVTKPVIGDFDGDRRADIAGVVNVNGQIVFVIKGSRNNAETAQAWGVGSDAIMSGDYDGDGWTDYAVYRASEGVWYVKTATNTIIRQWGISTDEPLNGDYDGNGVSDFVVYRVENGHGYFYILGDNGQYKIHQFGLAGDIPIGRDVIR